MSTFITRLADAGPAGSLRLAVKDCIDVAGVPTTVGCRVLADRCVPAARDAACLAGFRAAGATIVGKANLHELCFGATGVNPHFGTPRNPFDAALVPGGSSSGSGVAVATDEADIALGTDTTGSVRNPAAYCGVVGIRPTFGLVPVQGTWPLAPSLDTVGVLARTVAEVARGLSLAVPQHPPFDASSPPVVGRLRVAGTDPVYDEAIDRVLSAAELDVRDVDLPAWDAATEAARTIAFAEALCQDRELYAEAPERLGQDVRARFDAACKITPDQEAAARRTATAWRVEVGAWLGTATSAARVGALVVPSMLTAPPRCSDGVTASNPAALAPSLLRGPALSLPVPCGRVVPASVQLLGPAGGDTGILALGARLEQAAASLA